MDNRAQAIQLGFILVVAIVLIGVSIYQASVVPGQNEAVEQDDYQTARGGLIELSDNIYTSGERGSPATTTLKTGSQYQSRFFFQNPPNPQGTVRTQEQGEYQIQNAVATDDDTAKYWDGTQWDAQSNDIVFTPNYNQIRRDNHHITGAGVTYIDNDNKHIIREQSLVSDTTVSLMAVRGGLDESGQSIGLNIRPAASDTREITLTDEGDPITLTVPTELSADVWENKIVSDQLVANGGSIESVEDTATGVDIILEQGVSYTFVLNEVTVSRSTTQTSTSRLDAAYATSDTDTDISIDVDEQETLRTAILSKFNTPVSNEQVTVEVLDGDSNIDVVDAALRTDSNGQVETVVEGTDRGEATVRVFFDDGSTPAKYVDYTATVGGSGSGSEKSFELGWDNPATISANDGAVVDCDSTECTWDPSRSDGELTLRGSLSPTVTGIGVDFGLSDTSQATLVTETTTTNTDGQAETVLENDVEFGSVDVYAASGGGSDVIRIIIDDNALNDVVADFTFSPETPEEDETITFDGSSSTSPDGETITDYEWDWTSNGEFDATGETATHSYDSAGEYDVTLQTTASNGEQDTVTKTVSVNAPPNAFFTADPNPSEPNQEITFDASESSDSDGTIVEYEWDFTGDGTFESSGTEETETNAYDESGSYEATLRVTDDDGATDTYTRTVTVSEPPRIDRIVASDASGGPNVRFNADWEVSDPNGGLSQVTLELQRDSTGEIVDQETIPVEGGSAADTTRLDGERGTNGEEYTVIITVENVDGRTATDSDSALAG